MELQTSAVALALFLLVQVAVSQPTCNGLTTEEVFAIDPAARELDCPDNAALGSKCSLTCIDGYTVVEKVDGVCEVNPLAPESGQASYTQTQITCRASTCRPLNVNEIAAISPKAMWNSSCPEDAPLGTKCGLVCQDGFDPVPPSTAAECLPDPGSTTASYQRAVINCEEHNGCTAVPCPSGALCQDFPPPWTGRAGRNCTCTPDFVAREECCYSKEPPVCGAREFLCRNGRCVENMWLCTGSDECGDNSDETVCNTPCPPGTFACSNGKCISQIHRCSTVDDCGDNSDELNCFAPCPEYTIPCDSGQCIPLWTKCDRRRHCVDGADERNCFAPCDARLFDCGNGNCIPTWWRCNDGGNNLCQNFADEIDCSPPCIPDCVEKQCGDDDCCNGKCQVQTCPRGQACVQGECTCVPDCSGTGPCGRDDGCGGRCFGTCQGGQTCEQPNCYCATRRIYAAQDLPKSLNEDSNQVLVSWIDVPDQGTVMDVDVLGIVGTHSWFADLRFQLASPEGSIVEILRRSCTNGNRYQNFNFSLDDDVNRSTIDCPPTLGRTYKPSWPLHAFHGEQGRGRWHLYLHDEYAQDSGTLMAWKLGLAFCVPNCTGKLCGADDGCGDRCTVTTTAGCEGIPCATSPMCFEGECRCRPDCSGAHVCGASDGAGGLCSNTNAGCARDLSCVQGACGVPVYNSSDLPQHIQSDVDRHTVLSRLVVPPAAGSLTVREVRVLGVRGQHTSLGDLTFSLVSPRGTRVDLMHPRCGSYANFHFSFSDAAAFNISAGPCPATDGGTYRPYQPLAAFNLEEAAGNWTLSILDDGSEDAGRLDAWALQIRTCESDCTNKVCGANDLCGGVCVTQRGCAVNMFCSQAGVCLATPSTSPSLSRSPSSLSSLSSPSASRSRLSSPSPSVSGSIPPGTRSLSPSASPVCGAMGCVASPVCGAMDTCGQLCPGAAASCPVTTVQGAPLGDIPDKSNVTGQLQVGADMRLVDVRVRLKGIHELLGDVIISLRSPSGTSVELLSRPCGPTGSFDFIVQDMVGAFPCPPPVNGSAVPAAKPKALAALQGEQSGGVWQLTAWDLQESSTGSIDGWSLLLRGVCPAAEPDCAGCKADCNSAKACGDPDGCGGTCMVASCGGGLECLLNTSTPSSSKARYTCSVSQSMSCDMLDPDCLFCTQAPALKCLSCSSGAVSSDGMRCVQKCGAGETSNHDGHCVAEAMTIRFPKWAGALIGCLVGAFFCCGWCYCVVCPFYQRKKGRSQRVGILQSEDDHSHAVHEVPMQKLDDSVHDNDDTLPFDGPRPAGAPSGLDEPLAPEEGSQVHGSVRAAPSGSRANYGSDREAEGLAADQFSTGPTGGRQVREDRPVHLHGEEAHAEAGEDEDWNMFDNTDANKAIYPFATTLCQPDTSVIYSGITSVSGRLTFHFQPSCPSGHLSNLNILEFSFLSSTSVTTPHGDTYLRSPFAFRNQSLR
eukprot:g74040.t1